MTRTFWIVVILAGLIAGTAWWRRSGSQHATATVTTATKGDVKRGSDGRLLYYDGKQWTNTPLPAQDTPF